MIVVAWYLAGGLVSMLAVRAWEGGQANVWRGGGSVARLIVAWPFVVGMLLRGCVRHRMAVAARRRRFLRMVRRELRAELLLAKGQTEMHDALRRFAAKVGTVEAEHQMGLLEWRLHWHLPL